ncbi:hypothetical protein BpHYR1_033281 [Brachionus plicatilis]|uniref:Uncharacterized protein n=1 Tax=Brachionus plicatilis TaxID=10195 RepID=A0A3M7R872_BRAPC|nr:hypothetical protein BpHYR1_033281 [Brachionus plicatilis]
MLQINLAHNLLASFRTSSSVKDAVLSAIYLSVLNETFFPFKGTGSISKIKKRDVSTINSFDHIQEMIAKKNLPTLALNYFEIMLIYSKTLRTLKTKIIFAEQKIVDRRNHLQTINHLLIKNNRPNITIYNKIFISKIYREINYTIFLVESSFRIIFGEDFNSIKLILKNFVT